MAKTKTPRTQNKSKKASPKTTSKKKNSAKKSTVKSEPEIVEKVVPVVQVVEEETVVQKPGTPVAKPSTTDGEPVVTEMKLDDNISGGLESLLTTIGGVMSQLKTLQTDVKGLQKSYAKLLKDHDKTVNKKKRQNRKPSGFAKPSALSTEMTSFLGLKKDVEVARNEVTKMINKYIVDNNLRKEEDKRQILPDKKLSKLLNLDGSEQLSYFNLQKYIKHHFVKTEVVA
jgi:chromatin remodeling complex protein RSC6